MLWSLLSFPGMEPAQFSRYAALELEYNILKEKLGSSTTLIKFTKPLSYYRVLRLCKSKIGESV